MKTMTTGLRWWVRIVGTVMIVLGLSIWTGNFDRLIPFHILLGVTLVIALWLLAIIAAESGVQLGLVALAVAWGLIMPALGLTQERLLPGSAHWVIQIVHLLVGLGAIGQAENLARQIGRRHALQQGARGASALERIPR